MKVAVLNFPGVIATSVSGPYDMLDKVKTITASINLTNKIHFDVDIVNSDTLADTQQFYMAGNKTIKSKTVYDLIIIPAMNFDCIESTLRNEANMMEWIKYQYKNGSDVASICLGAFILATTGVLNGKRATTHWMGAPYFRQMFPEVDLQDEKVIIDEGRIYTCGAAFSFTTLMLYLIEKFCGRDVALATAKVFMIQVHDTGQTAFSIFSLQHNHEDTAIRNVQHYVEKNYSQPLAVNELATRFNMSQRSFIRRFTHVTGNTPLEYIQRVRVEAAKRSLEKGKHTVEEICLRSGYGDFHSFRNIFKRFTGLTPQEYKRKYGQMFNEVVVG